MVIHTESLVIGVKFMHYIVLTIILLLVFKVNSTFELSLIGFSMLQVNIADWSLKRTKIHQPIQPSVPEALFVPIKAETDRFQQPPFHAQELAPATENVSVSSARAGGRGG